MIGRSRALVATSLLALMVLAGAACDVVFQGMNAQASDQWTRTYKLEEGGTVEITNPNGMIDVSPSADATTVEVVAERRARAGTEAAARQELKAIEITEQVTPKQVRLEVARGRSSMHFGRQSREVSFKVKVPRSASVKLNTRNGELRIVGITGPVKADSTNGNVVCENVGGAVEIGATNGDLKVQVTGIAPDGIRMDTTNGDIDLRLPGNAKASISARWVNGDFETSGLKPEGQSERRRYTGSLNGGGPRIELNTTNGRIRISS